MDFSALSKLLPDFVGLLFTLFVLSYVAGDNPTFRLAVHAFIGISAGYVAAVVLMQVIANQMILPLSSGVPAQSIPAGIAIFLGLVLMAKISQGTEWIARPVVAFLVGTGTAAAVAGAMLGTIYPQAAASINSFTPDPDPVKSILMPAVILAGTIATLAYFQFTVFGKTPGGRRGWLMTGIALLGQAFIAITLGALFAGALSAALTALVDRIQFIVLFFDNLAKMIFPH